MTVYAAPVVTFSGSTPIGVKTVTLAVKFIVSPGMSLTAAGVTVTPPTRMGWIFAHFASRGKPLELPVHSIISAVSASRPARVRWKYRKRTLYCR